MEIKPPPNFTPPEAAQEADEEEKKLERAVNRNLRERKARRVAATLDKIAASAVSTDDFFSSPPNKDGRTCPGCGVLFKECEPLPDVDMCETCERFGPPKEKVAGDTVQAYKQFRTLKSQPGSLFPLFINKTNPVPEGEWMEAENIPTEGFAPRPGWHAGALPAAPHLRAKDDRIQPNRVWAEVELPADIDWQAIADKSPTKDIRDEVPKGGHYRKPTPRMQGGEWLIGGGLKVNRQLSDDDVSSILRDAGEHDAAEKERRVKEGASLAQQIATARHKTKEPKSEAQAEAGNYPKGKVNMHGMTISLENPRGSTRSGTDPNGKSWSIKMENDYGYIARTTGRDGDHVDVFLGRSPDTELVFVVDQETAGGTFDEHKCMLGFATAEEAKAGYLANYEAGWSNYGEITALTLPQFKWWLEHGDQNKRVAKAKIKVATDSHYLNALNANTLGWDTRSGIADNLMANLGRVKRRGDRSIREAASMDRLQNAMDPDRSMRQLQSYLAGTRKPIVNHPLDRVVQEVGQ